MVSDIDQYFKSYEDLEIHELMLRDKPRNEAYRHAILSNRDLFEDKLVLDVGSGTGILSCLAAQAGARKVFAVEASNLAELSRKIIKENDFENVVEVFNCRIEDFNLPNEVEKVDVIISEFMGFYLLHEGMLDSVLLARDRFLADGGSLFPDRAVIYVAPCLLSCLFKDWDSVSGIKMRTFAEELRRSKQTKPEIVALKSDDLLATEAVMTFLDLNDLTSKDLNMIEFNEVMVANKIGSFEGVCVWFDVLFPSSGEEVVLSTGPDAEPTHWKQTVVPMLEYNMTVEVGTPIAFKLTLQRHPQHFRRYNIFVEILDPFDEAVEHPVPCQCGMTKCILTKAHLESIEEGSSLAA